MQFEQIAPALSPLYGLWSSANHLWAAGKAGAFRSGAYGSPRRGDRREHQSFDRSGSLGEPEQGRAAAAAGFVMFLLLVVFVVLVPAAQAFSCFGATNLALPGWAWGALILLFWPMGLLWLVFRGGCADGIPDLVRPGDTAATTALLVSPAGGSEGCSFFA